MSRPLDRNGLMYSSESITKRIINWDKDIDPTLAPLEHPYTDDTMYRELRSLRLFGVLHCVKFVPSLQSGLNKIQLNISDTPHALMEGYSHKEYVPNPGVKISKRGSRYKIEVNGELLAGSYKLEDLLKLPQVFKLRDLPEENLGFSSVRLIDPTISMEDLSEEREIAKKSTPSIESYEKEGFFLIPSLYKAFQEGRHYFENWQQENQITYKQIFDYGKTCEFQFESIKFKQGTPNYAEICSLISIAYEAQIEAIEEAEELLEPPINLGLISSQIGQKISKSTAQYIIDQLDRSFSPKDTFISLGEIETWSDTGISEHIARSYIINFLKSLGRPAEEFVKIYTWQDRPILRILNETCPFIKSKPNYKYKLIKQRKDESLKDFKQRQFKYNSITFQSEAHYWVWLCFNCGALPVLSGTLYSEAWKVADWHRYPIKRDGEKGSIKWIKFIRDKEKDRALSRLLGRKEKCFEESYEKMPPFSEANLDNPLFPELTRFFFKWLGVYETAPYKNYTDPIKEDIKEVLAEFRNYQNNQLKKLVGLNTENLLNNFCEEIKERDKIAKGDPSRAREQWKGLMSFLYSREKGLVYNLKPTKDIILPLDIFKGDMRSLWRSMGYLTSEVPRTRLHLAKMISEQLLRIPMNTRRKRFEKGKLVSWNIPFDKHSTSYGSGIVGELLSYWWRKHIGFRIPTYQGNILTASLADLKEAYPKEVYGKEVARKLFKAAQKWGFQKADRPTPKETDDTTLNRIERFIHQAFPFQENSFSLSPKEIQRQNLTKKEIESLKESFFQTQQERNSEIRFLRIVLTSWNPEVITRLLQTRSQTIENYLPSSNNFLENN